MRETELRQSLEALMAAQLVVEASADELAFRHALTREAVYATLLVRERKRYHRAIAETLEQLYAPARDEHVGDLAYHFFQSEAWEPALEYSKRAGERAQSMYAPREAIEHFTRAIQAAEQFQGAAFADLYRRRGRAYETVGNFEAALADYEHARQALPISNDGREEWQSLIDLGFLWASRDYAQTGEYFERALELARAHGDPRLVAHSLNRVGNWQVNIEQPREAARLHLEALSIFEGLGDTAGVAESNDLLGMANMIAGDLSRAKSHLNRAIDLLRASDERTGLASSLTVLMVCGSSYQSDTLVVPSSLAEAIAAGEQALQIAREIGHRAAESFASWALGAALGRQGEYSRAFAAARAGLAVAEAIEHRQWQCAAHFVLGALQLDLFAFDQAEQHLSRSLTITEAIGSAFWRRYATAYLALVYVRQGHVEHARELLDAALPPGVPAQTSAQRSLQAARVEALLAAHEPEAALRIADELLDSAANISEGQVIPRLAYLKSQALAALGRNESAEAVLAPACVAAEALGVRSLTWRMEATRARLHAAMGDEARAESERARARAALSELASGLDDAPRERFLEQALAWIAQDAK